jgi:hypothetical protein
MSDSYFMISDIVLNQVPNLLTDTVFIVAIFGIMVRFIRTL